MRKIYKKTLALLCLMLILDFLSAQGGGGGGGWRPPSGPKKTSQYLAGAELKFRKLNKSTKLDPSVPDTVQVLFVIYRDCEANAGSTYTSPQLIDTIVALLYSKSLCEYTRIGLWYTPELSQSNATPLCPYNPAKTKCDTAIVSNAGYRTEVYADTVVLRKHTCDWIVGLQMYNGATDARMNWYTKKYDPQGERCSLDQINPPPPGTTYLGAVPRGMNPPSPFSFRIAGINTLSQANDPTESYFYIEATYCNEVPDGYYSKLDKWGRKIPRYKANTTPNSAANPLIFQCLGVQRIYDLGYYDEDGDEMTFYTSTPMKAACFGDPACGQPDRTISYLQWASGCSESNPLCGSSVYNLDAKTGILEFQAASNNPVGKYKTAFRITEKTASGKQIGEVYRDVVMTIINPPNCANSNSVANSSYFIDTVFNFLNSAKAPNRDKTIEVCAGSSMRFSTSAFSTSDIQNAALVITAEFHPYMLKTGAFVTSYYIPHNFPIFDTAVGTFYWNVPDTTEPGLYPVIFQIRDCVDGYILSRTVVYKVRVNKKNRIDWTYLGFDPQLTEGVFSLNPKSRRSYNCGADVTHLYSANGVEDGALYDWSMYDTTGGIWTVIANDPSQFFSPSNIDLAANVTKNLIVVLNTNQYCQNSDTLTIVSKPSINPTLDTTLPDLCFGTVGKLEVLGLSGSAAVTSLFDWQAINSEYASTPSYLSNTADIILTKPTNIYNVYVITADTCIFPLSKSIDLDGIKPRAEFTTNKQYVCPGDTIDVATPLMTTSICGQSQFSIPTGPTKIAEYDGTQSNTNPSPKIFTATSAIDRGRTQLLYLAKELKAKNFKPGLVKGISFYIDGVSDPSDYNNIDIWVRCTNRTDLQNQQFEDTADMIKLGSYSTKSLSTGWNTFSFGGGFTWDAQTNLIFEVSTSCNKPCNSNVPASPAYGDHLTNYVSVIGKYGNGDINFAQAAPVSSNYRHNIRFIYQDLLENLTYKWDNDPTTLVSVVNPGSSGENEAKPRIVSQIPRTYIITTTNGKCDTKDTLEALIDSNYKIVVTPDRATKCPGDTVHLTSTKGYLQKRPLILKCGIDNLIADSCRKVDSLMYPLFGNIASTAGNFLHSPFGGRTAATGVADPTTDKRIQILLTSAELKSNPNMRAGYIREINFNIKDNSYYFANINKMMNLSVRMKCAPSTQDSFLNDNFESLALFNDVYFADEYVPIPGINSIPLQKEFAWDSTSGIIIDICFDNYTGASFNANRVIATTQTKKRYLYKAGNTTGIQPDEYGCTYLTGTRDFIRPNVGLTVCKPTRTPPPIPTSVNWAPLTYISNTQVTNPIVYNQFTTKYYTILDYVDTTYGKYKVVCRVRDTMNSIVDRPYVKFDPPVAVACEGKSVNVSAGVVGMNQNLYTYEWDTTQYGKVKANYLNPNQVITPPNPGYHYVTISRNSKVYKETKIKITKKGERPGDPDSVYYISKVDSSQIGIETCWNRDSIWVDIQKPQTMPDIGGATLICPGDSVLLSIPTGLGYKNPKWRFNGSVIDTGYSLKVTRAGDYSIIVDSAACTNTSNVKVISNRTQQIATLTTTTMTVCEGDSALILYTEGDNVSNPLWNNGMTTPYIKVNQAGKYYLIKPKDQYGCYMKVRDTATVNLISNPDFTLNDDIICLNSNQKVTLQPVPFDPTATYRWEPENRNLPYLDVYTPGEITCIRTKNNCTKIAKAMIINDTSGAIDLGKDKAVCCDEVITLDANPDGKKYKGFVWSTGEFSQVIYTKGNTSGLYVVEAIKPNGCKDTGSIFIDSKCGQVKAKPARETIYLSESNKIIGEHLTLNGQVSYKWIPSNKLNELLNGDSLNFTARPKDTGDVEYVLVMTVNDPKYMPPKPFCIENEVVRFKVLPNEIDPTNIFSPNDDGDNDYIYPRIKGVVDIKEFKVYNRFGQLLHNDSNKAWDGKYMGEPQPVGVYVAMLAYDLEVPNKKVETKYKTIPITLIR